MRPPPRGAGWSAPTSAARSARLSTIRNSSVAVDLAAAHAHRVDHRHAAGGDIVAVAHPAGRLPADRLAEVGAGLLDQVEQRFGLGRQRLGRAAEAAVDLDRRRRARRRPPRPPRRSRACASRLDRRASRGRRLTRSTARSGTTLLGLPPSIRDGLTVRPGALRRGRAAARGRRRRAARCGRPRDCARHGPSGRARRTRNCRFPAALRRAFRRAAPRARRSAPRACPARLARAAPPKPSEPTSSSLLITTS